MCGAVADSVAAIAGDIGGATRIHFSSKLQLCLRLRCLPSPILLSPWFAHLPVFSLIYFLSLCIATNILNMFRFIKMLILFESKPPDQSVFRCAAILGIITEPIPRAFASICKLYEISKDAT